jgi:hypothetical protein
MTFSRGPSRAFSYGGADGGTRFRWGRSQETRNGTDGANGTPTTFKPYQRSDLRRHLGTNTALPTTAPWSATIYHHKPERIEAHLFVAFLAYCLSITLRQQLRTLAPGLMPRVVLGKLAALQMLDVIVPTTDDRELILVRHTEPNRDVALLLDQLGRSLPAQPPPKIRTPAAPLL